MLVDIFNRLLFDAKVERESVHDSLQIFAT